MVAACPLSMLLMMRAMNGQAPDAQQPTRPAAPDREAVLRGELADLATRQERVIVELRAIEASRPGTAASDGARLASHEGG
jgi:hypothetical protein